MRAQKHHARFVQIRVAAVSRVALLGAVEAIENFFTVKVGARIDGYSIFRQVPG